jgi:hypothetical protein
MRRSSSGAQPIVVNASMIVTEFIDVSMAFG